MSPWNTTRPEWERNKDHARENRSNMSQPEKNVWKCISGKKMDGFKFRRQHCIGPYIADFYCHDLRLILEIDGWSHDDTLDYDQRRNAYFAANHFCVYHMQVDQILHRMDDVKEEIANLVMALAEEQNA
jgi:very-short-patch-repair endonuclease